MKSCKPWLLCRFECWQCLKRVSLHNIQRYPDADEYVRRGCLTRLCWSVIQDIQNCPLTVTDEYVRRSCEVKGETFENISKGISSKYSEISRCWWICEEWLRNEGEDGEIVLSVVTQCQRPQHVVMITICFSYSCFVQWCAYLAVLHISAYEESNRAVKIGCSWKAPDIKWIGAQ